MAPWEKRGGAKEIYGKEGVFRFFKENFRTIGFCNVKYSYGGFCLINYACFVRVSLPYFKKEKKEVHV